MIDEDQGMTFDNVDLNVLGRAKKIVVGKDDTVIIDGHGPKQDIKDRIEMIN